MERTSRSMVEDRGFGLLEKVQAEAVKRVHQMAEAVDAWWPQLMKGRFTERLPAYLDRGVHVAEREFDHEYKLAKRLFKNQHGFLKEVGRAMAPPKASHPAGKPPMKAAA